MTKINRFQRGSGAYKCRCCEQLTRERGGDGHQVRLCQECFDVAGWYNSCQDTAPGDLEFDLNLGSLRNAVALAVRVRNCKSCASDLADIESRKG
jgi:hypothetical protein